MFGKEEGLGLMFQSLFGSLLGKEMGVRRIFFFVAERGGGLNIERRRF